MIFKGLFRPFYVSSVLLPLFTLLFRFRSKRRDRVGLHSTSPLSLPHPTSTRGHKKGSPSVTGIEKQRQEAAKTNSDLNQTTQEIEKTKSEVDLTRWEVLSKAGDKPCHERTRHTTFSFLTPPPRARITHVLHYCIVVFYLHCLHQCLLFTSKSNTCNEIQNKRKSFTTLSKPAMHKIR